jgi:hypothetical protein
LQCVAFAVCCICSVLHLQCVAVCHDSFTSMTRYFHICATTYSYAVCCSVLQCVAVCCICSVLQCIAVCCSVLQCIKALWGGVCIGFSVQMILMRTKQNRAQTERTELLKPLYISLIKQIIWNFDQHSKKYTHFWPSQWE